MTATLSRRHLQVIAGLARGHTHARIGTHLGISEKAVKSRQADITSITGARGAAAIVDWAYRNGILTGLTPEPRQPVELSDREIEVLELAAIGLTNKQIAPRVGITASTVATHLERIYSRLGVHVRHHAVAIAHQQGHLDAARRALPLRRVAA